MHPSLLQMFDLRSVELGDGDLEGAIVFLTSAASDDMNGSALILDGGYLSW